VVARRWRRFHRSHYSSMGGSFLARLSGGIANIYMIFLTEESLGVLALLTVFHVLLVRSPRIQLRSVDE
jgi:hypothetical protein